VVGVGVAGKSHLFDLVSDDRFAVVTVCASRRDTAEHAAHTFGVTHAHDDPDALLVGGRLDGIVLATPPAVTPVLLRRALDAGLAVLVEKPGAGSAADLRAVVQGAPAAQRVAVAYNRRYQRHVHEARRLVAAGALGPPNEVGCRWRAPFRERYSGGDTFRPRVPWGHGVVLDTACHVLDTLLFLGLGPLTVSAARLVRGATDADVEAHFDLIGRDGVRITTHIDEGPHEDWVLALRGPLGTMTITRSQLVTTRDGHTERVEQDDLARPVDDLLRLGTGRPPRGATATEATSCLSVVDAVRRVAVRRPWSRPRAKALGRLNGAC